MDHCCILTNNNLLILDNNWAGVYAKRILAHIFVRKIAFSQ